MHPAGSCGCSGGGATAPSVVQSLSELDFDRGVWSAALTGDLPRLKCLVEGADGRKRACVDARDSGGYTALHYACRAGHLGVCEYLLDAGADPNAPTRSGAATPLHRAAITGRLDCTRLLLARGAKPDALDADGRCPASRAAEAGHSELADLIEKAKLESAG